MLYRLHLSAGFVVATLLASLAVNAAAPQWPAVRPLFEETCYDCHSATKRKGGVDLKSLADDPAVEGNYALWEKVKEVVAKGEMPPEDETQLTSQEKQQLIGWVGHTLDAVAAANSGDPGPVTLRRLTNAEYDYTIRDLTGHDYGLGKEFMPDGGGGEGFSNTGDVLFVNPAQLDKYLAAARKLVDHATVMPGTGIRFHPQRVGLRGPDQVKGQADQALYVWYQKASGPHLPKNEDDLREADYMLACWKWKHKEQTGAKSLEELAKAGKLSPIFLENWWRILNDTKTPSRFLDLTRVPWRNLPGPDAAKPKEVPPAVLASLKEIEKQRKAWYTVGRPGQSSVQRQQQDADGIRTSGRFRAVIAGQRQVHVVIGDDGDGNQGDYVQIQGLSIRLKGKVHEYAAWMKKQLADDKKALADLKAGKPAAKGVTAESLNKRSAEAEAVLALFGKDPLGKKIPETVLAVKAPRVVTLPLPEGTVEVFGAGKLDMQNPEIDEATAQWTVALGKAPDPAQIIPGVLTVWKRQTPKARQTMGDFSRMKAAFPDNYDRRLEEVARNHTRGDSLLGVYYFSDEQLGRLISAKEYRYLQDMDLDYTFTARKASPQTLADWDKRVIGHVQGFAFQAWRRPLADEERKQFEALYREGVKQGLDRESAAREVMVRVLVSPNFLYKTEVGVIAAEPAESPTKEVALNAWELASRLSYFLWSSKPDWQLREAAKNGSLTKPDVLVAQVKRMMKDPKAEAMAKEFAGQWLDFSGFASHSGVDEQKFPEYTPELRNDLARETLMFFTHLVRQDRPVQEILHADYTFLNERLAKHYGVPGVTGEEFRQVKVTAHHRGGLLGQGSVLTKTSRSHRTSPVLRGNWLLQAVLGTPVPPPPPDVPELKEHGPKPATMRQMLEQHRAAKACSSCHDRIDPLGFALENFDAIGRYRDKDETGAPLDTSGRVKSAQFTGFEGLRDYLRSQEPQVTHQLCRKLLGYALGRQVLPTDKALLEQMEADLKKSDGRFSAPVLTIVQSRQFLNKRL